MKNANRGEFSTFVCARLEVHGTAFTTRCPDS
jgi:hypothetical protein